MHNILLCMVTLLNIGSLKTEPIDYLQKIGRMDMFPVHQEQENDMALLPSHAEDDNENDWNDIFFKQRPKNFRKNINYENDRFDFPEEQFKTLDQLDDVQLVQFSKYLIKFLQQPELWEPPLILVKDSQDNLEDSDFPLELDGLQDIVKRSRYYRRYPWKRQNSRSHKSMEYDPYTNCNPTRNDVFQLLVALHDARQGNKSRIVNFCNRRRPASSVYTNIRFLGRRRK